MSDLFENHIVGFLTRRLILYSGHCGKTMAIMKRAVTEDHIKDVKWLLIADDDTIIK